MNLDRSERRALRDIEKDLADSDSRLNELFCSFTLQGRGQEMPGMGEDEVLARTTDRAGRTRRRPSRSRKGLAYPALDNALRPGRTSRADVCLLLYETWTQLFPDLGALTPVRLRVLEERPEDPLSAAIPGADYCDRVQVPTSQSGRAPPGGRQCPPAAAVPLKAWTSSCGSALALGRCAPVAPRMWYLVSAGAWNSGKQRGLRSARAAGPGGPPRRGELRRACGRCFSGVI